MVAPIGYSCTTACAGLGGCVQGAFDNKPSIADMQLIAAAAGINCGGEFFTEYASDPMIVIDWGSEPACFYNPATPPSCSAPGQWSDSQRLCPCANQGTTTPTRSPTHSPTHTPVPTPWSLSMAHWTLAATGDSCTTACAGAGGGCIAGAFDTTPGPDEMAQIAGAAGVVCPTMYADQGSESYDPLFWNSICWWGGPVGKGSCSAVYPGGQRFCPCANKLTPTPTRTPTQTPAPTVWSVSVGHWMVGPLGASCTTACENAGGCLQAGFDTSPSSSEMLSIASEVGLTCGGLYSSSNSPSNPAIDSTGTTSSGPICWNAAGPSTCDAPAWETTQRFCPCVQPVTATPTHTPSQTAAPTVWSVAVGFWMIGPQGASCSTACTSAGGCVQAAFDESPSSSEMQSIASAVGLSCAGVISTSNSESNPAIFASSTDPICWNAVGGSSTCDAAALANTQRFCPCANPVTPTPSSSPSQTPAPTVWTVDAGHWMIAPKLASCTTACMAAGGCLPGAFDDVPNAADLQLIAAAAGATCKAVYTDGSASVSDPAIVGTITNTEPLCFYNVDYPVSCDVVPAYSNAQRLCPCARPVTRTPSHTASLSRTASPSPCPPGYSKHGGTSCFSAQGHTSVSWASANSQCTKGGHLATLTTASDVDYVINGACGTTQSSIWIGFRDTSTSKTRKYVWSTSSTSYVSTSQYHSFISPHWGAGPLSGTTVSNNKCAVVNKGATGKPNYLSLTKCTKLKGPLRCCQTHL